MTRSLVQPASAGEGGHLVLYDGVCGLCSRLLQFLIAHDRDATFCFASLQSAVGRETVTHFGGNPGQLTSFCVVVNYRTNGAHMLIRSRAALFVAGQIGWPWKAAVLLRVLPTVMLDRVYDVIARHRYRVFGRHDQCLVPHPDVRRRFID